MSVTIYPAQVDPSRAGWLRKFPSVERRVPCDACAGGYCQPGWCEDGVEVVHEPTAPECNFANLNVRPLFAAVGLDAGEYLSGALDPSEIAGVIAECEAALASTAFGLTYRAGMLRDVVVVGLATIAGSDDTRARERIASLLHVLRWAHKHGAGVAWG